MPVKQLEIRQVDGQYEVFSLVEKTVKQRLSHIITNAPKITQPTESLLAGSMSMALCYISRVGFTSLAKTLFVINPFSLPNPLSFNGMLLLE